MFSAVFALGASRGRISFICDVLEAKFGIDSLFSKVKFQK